MAGVTTRATAGVPLTATNHDDNLEAMITLHKGTAEPSPTYGGMLWLDTSNSLVKQRTVADDGWNTLGSTDSVFSFVPTKDEDNMASDSATHLATQQSIKAYVDTQVSSSDELVEDTSPQLGGNLDFNGNTVHGVDSTEMAILDGATVTTAELNYLDITTLGTVEASKAVTADASGNVSFGDGNITNVGDISLDSISSDAGTSINVVLGSDAGDDFTVDTSKLVVEGDTGNVGIGMTPTQKLEVNGGIALPTTKLLRWNNSGTIAGAISVDNSNNMILYNTEYNTERMRIDSSGNVLVGTTDSAPYDNNAGTSADNGVLVGADGLFAVATYNTCGTNFNRTGSDGDVVRFRKDGTTVGSIGCRSSGHIGIGEGDVGIAFRGDQDCIVPVNPSSTFVDRANNIDIGNAGNRFKEVQAMSGLVLIVLQHL